MKDEWGMTAEDHEKEQDEHLRSLGEQSVQKEVELLEAVDCLSRKANRNRKLLMWNLAGVTLGLLLTLVVLFLLYGQ